MTGRQLLVALAEWLCASWRSNAEAARLVNDMRLYLVPTINPDGFAAKQRGNRQAALPPPTAPFSHIKHPANSHPCTVHPAGNAHAFYIRSYPQRRIESMADTLLLTHGQPGSTASLPDPSIPSTCIQLQAFSRAAFPDQACMSLLRSRACVQESAQAHYCISCLHQSSPGNLTAAAGLCCSNGADLNRDFPDPIFGLPGLAASGQEQPETQAIMRWSNSTRFVAGAQLHEVLPQLLSTAFAGSDGRAGQNAGQLF